MGIFDEVMERQKRQGLEIRERKLHPPEKPKIGRPKGGKTKNPIENLSPRHQLYAQGRLAGLTKYDAGIAAGFPHISCISPSTHIENEEYRRAFVQLARQLIPTGKMIRRIKQGMDAKKPIYATQDGKITDIKKVPDHSERRKSTITAAEFTGAWTPEIQACKLNWITEWITKHPF